MPDRPYAGLIKYDARDPEARFPPIEPSDDASSDGDLQFGVDITSQAIAWVRQQQMLVPDKPFSMYYPPGACHAPHHMPQEWIDHYNGMFDQGSDHVREETPTRQEELGVVPPAALNMAQTSTFAIALLPEVGQDFAHAPNVLEMIMVAGLVAFVLLMVVGGELGNRSQGTPEP